MNNDRIYLYSPKATEVLIALTVLLVVQYTLLEYPLMFVMFSILLMTGVFRAAMASSNVTFLKDSAMIYQEEHPLSDIELSRRYTLPFQYCIMQISTGRRKFWFLVKSNFKDQEDLEGYLSRIGTTPKL